MQARPIENPALIKTFVLGGNARFTLVSKKTGERFTYQAKTNADRKVWFISVLTGSNNEEDYSYFGTVFNGDTFRHGRKEKTRISDNAPSARAFNWFFERVAADVFHSDKIEFWHEGRCCRCNRVLTDPASIESGIGPECAKKI